LNKEKSFKIVRQQRVEKWSRFELVLTHPNPANSYTSINISSRFYNKDTSFVVKGFYKGNLKLWWSWNSFEEMTCLT
jgi:hypothetical protein